MLQSFSLSDRLHGGGVVFGWWCVKFAYRFYGEGKREIPVRILSMWRGFILSAEVLTQSVKLFLLGWIPFMEAPLVIKGSLVVIKCSWNQYLKLLQPSNVIYYLNKREDFLFVIVIKTFLWVWNFYQLSREHW